MRALLRRMPVLALFLLLLLGLPGSGATPLRAAYDFSGITALIQSAADSSAFDGASLILVKDGQVIYQETFGTLALDTVVPIASGSKWLTAATILALVDDGLLALDDPVSRYLPGFAGGREQITIRQLLAHTSGLPSAHPCLDDSSISLAECVDRISQAGLAAAPGTRFSYGGASYQVAGRVAEVASGKPWATLFEEEIKGPLGMTATSYGETQNPSLAAGATTSLLDYAGFLQMQLGGGSGGSTRVLSVSSLEEMRQDQTCGVPIISSPHRDGRRYGLGVWRDVADADGNAVQISCQGDTGFSPWIDLQRNLLGVFLVHDDLGDVYRLVAEIQQRTREVIDAAGSS